MTERKVSKRGRVGEGRPSKYKPEYCDKLIEHMSKSYSYESFGYDLEINTSTLYEWEKSYPEFYIAKKKAFKACRAWWERKGKALMNGKIKGGSAAIWIFVMKCRFGYIDTQIDLSNMPTDQLKELVKKALEKIEEAEGKNE